MGEEGAMRHTLIRRVEDAEEVGPPRGGPLGGEGLDPSPLPMLCACRQPAGNQHWSHWRGGHGRVRKVSSGIETSGGDKHRREWSRVGGIGAHGGRAYADLWEHSSVLVAQRGGSSDNQDVRIRAPVREQPRSTSVHIT